jgi:hypothetical protein
MKKIAPVMIALLLVSTAAIAAGSQKKEMPGMDMDQPMGMMMPGMGKMCCPMMGKAQMAATDDGGVIVLAGNKLMKYDADLVLLKEVEVPMPAGWMGGRQCPLPASMKVQDAGADQAAS